MKLVTLTLIIKFYSLICLGQGDHTNVTTWVNRRCSRDIYSHSMIDISHETCENDQTTYMVEEQRCIKNDDILKSMHIIIILLWFPNIYPCQCIGCRFALNDSCYGTSNLTFYMSLKKDIAIIDVNKSLNISLCQIASLEVYRGNESVTEISHSGFTLTDQNTMQVILWPLSGTGHHNVILIACMHYNPCYCYDV